MIKHQSNKNIFLHDFIILHSEEKVCGWTKMFTNSASWKPVSYHQYLYFPENVSLG